MRTLRHAGARARARAPTVALLALALAACGTLPPLEGRPESTAIPAAAGTRLYEAIAPLTAAQPGLTGVYALGEGRDAFAARVALAEAAERSLDVQYYIWHGDVSGRLMFEALRRAAERGIRVRLLLDDNNTKGLDPTLAALDAHANVEVRLFNPFVYRSLRPLGYATDFGRLNRRMHNKSFTVDGVATIVGGRNIGDEYFGAGAGIGFLDLDVIAIGPVVGDVARSFDDYWHSGSSYPANRLLPAATPESIAALAAQGRATLQSPAGSTYLQSVLDTKIVRAMLAGQVQWDWSEARLVVDEPSKGLGTAERGELLLTRLEQVVGPARRELQVISPYFVPGKTGVESFTRIANSGVDVVVLTNSLEATDVAAVHAGYAKRREALLRAGVRLYELKRAAAPVPVDGAADRRLFSGGSGSGDSDGASLHAKTFAVDRETLFVGSFNFDLRSALLNTEMGLVLRSPRLATRVAEAFTTAVPLAAYEVRLAADGGLEWHERGAAGERVHRTEPGTTGMQRFGVGVLSLLPIEWLL